jgi:D-glycero-beta-D-manno-heptose-7-phosphate kinase
MNLDEAGIDGILGRFQGKRIAVLGDLMLDRYYWGSVHRISPEAPVPVVEVESESVRFGGAANVANNIQALGGVPLLIGLVGNDHPGQMMAQMMTERGMDTSALVMDADRPTTIKTRVIASDQHVVRIDNEAKTPCPEHLQSSIVDGVRYHIHSLDAILIEDYNKGVITKAVIDEVLAVAHKYGTIVTVDPKFDHFLDFKGVTVFKPNRRETEEVLGGRLRTDEEVERAGRKLLELLDAENVLLTRGPDGMSLFERGGGSYHLPTAAEHVIDVSGAGDTVISTLTIALAAGASMPDACLLANCAGGVVVGSVGIVPVTPAQIREAAVRFIHSRMRS